MQDPDGETLFGVRDETADDSIILDASAGASGTVNGAVSDSRTVVVDGVVRNNRCRSSCDCKWCWFYTCCFNHCYIKKSKCNFC